MKLKQPKRFAVLFALAIALAVAGCGERTVTVQTGERVVCTYGETVSSTVKSIEVPASKASGYKVVTKTVTCEKHKVIEAIYAAAQRAIEAGDLKAARDKLAEVIGLDANFRKAGEQIALIDAGKKPVPDTGTGGTGSTTPTSTPGGGIPEGPVASLSTWVPDVIAGYKAEPVVADATALTRDYVPTSSKSVTSLVVVAEQFKDAASAKAAAAAMIASQYPSARSTVTADGRTLLYGASSKEFAAVAWNEGAVMIVVESYAAAGTLGSTKSELTSVAAAIIP